MAQCLSFWMTMVGTTALCTIPIFICKYLRELYSPQVSPDPSKPTTLNLLNSSDIRALKQRDSRLGL